MSSTWRHTAAQAQRVRVEWELNETPWCIRNEAPAAFIRPRNSIMLINRNGVFLYSNKVLNSCENQEIMGRVLGAPAVSSSSHKLPRRS